MKLWVKTILALTVVILPARAQDLPIIPSSPPVIMNYAPPVVENPRKGAVEKQKQKAAEEAAKKELEAKKEVFMAGAPALSEPASTSNKSRTPVMRNAITGEEIGPSQAKAKRKAKEERKRGQLSKGRLTGGRD